MLTAFPSTWICSEAFVAGVVKELADARTAVYDKGLGLDVAVKEIHQRFGITRKSGARRMKGDATPANGILWSFKDLRKGVA